MSQHPQMHEAKKSWSANQMYSQHPSLRRLEPLEKQYLISVERGDVERVTKLLEMCRRSPSLSLDVNCRDPVGRSATLMAIDSENLEMLEVLLEAGVESRDALLHAIAAEFVEAVDLLLEHEEAVHTPGELHSWEKVDRDISTFTGEITPLILAAHRDHYEILKLLLDKGATLPMPHDVRCRCDDCARAAHDDCLCHSRARINAYRALSSPSLICLTSIDPILTAFELSWELRRLSNAENEFKEDYLKLRSRCQDFATALLDHARSSRELEMVLNYDPGSPPYQHGDHMPLTRLEMAIKYKQKKFIAHPNVQQLLSTLWYDGLPGFRRQNPAYQLWDIFKIGVLFPFYSLLYVLFHGSRQGQLVKKPFFKFIIHSFSYLFFLLLLILASQRFDTVLAEWFGGSGTQMHSQEAAKKERGQSPTFLETFILLYIIAHIWQETKELWTKGLFMYFQNLWNIVDFVRNFLYVGTIGMRVLAYYQAQVEISENPMAVYIPREAWSAYDPMLIADGLFAAGNVFAALKLIHIFSINPYLGPLQISLGRMVIDIVKFIIIYALVLFAFACGLNQLLWYYADMERQMCFTGPGDTENWAQQRDACLAWRRFSNLFESSQTLFWASFGLVDLGNFELTGIKGYTRFWALLMFGSYSVINVVVLLNLLIAMMSNSYNIISERSDVEWKFARTTLFMNYFEKGGTLPPPFNLFPTLKYLLRLLPSKKSFKDMSFRRKEKKMKERDVIYQSVMCNLVWRYVTAQQKETESQPVTEDDVNELRQDVYTLRHDLLRVFRANGMNVKDVEKDKIDVTGKRVQIRKRRLFKDFSIGLMEVCTEEAASAEVVGGQSMLARLVGVPESRGTQRWRDLIQAAKKNKIIGARTTDGGRFGSIKKQAEAGQQEKAELQKSGQGPEDRAGKDGLYPDVSAVDPNATESNRRNQGNGGGNVSPLAVEGGQIYQKSGLYSKMPEEDRVGKDEGLYPDVSAVDPNATQSNRRNHGNGGGNVSPLAVDGSQTRQESGMHSKMSERDPVANGSVLYPDIPGIDNRNADDRSLSTRNNRNSGGGGSTMEMEEMRSSRKIGIGNDDGVRGFQVKPLSPVTSQPTRQIRPPAIVKENLQSKDSGKQISLSAGIKLSPESLLRRSPLKKPFAPQPADHTTSVTTVSEIKPASKPPAPSPTLSGNASQGISADSEFRGTAVLSKPEASSVDYKISAFGTSSPIVPGKWPQGGATDSNACGTKIVSKTSTSGFHPKEAATGAEAKPMSMESAFKPTARADKSIGKMKETVFMSNEKCPDTNLEAQSSTVRVKVENNAKSESKSSSHEPLLKLIDSKSNANTDVAEKSDSRLCPSGSQSKSVDSKSEAAAKVDLIPKSDSKPSDNGLLSKGIDSKLSGSPQPDAVAKSDFKSGIGSIDPKSADSGVLKVKTIGKLIRTDSKSIEIESFPKKDDSEVALNAAASKGPRYIKDSRFDAIRGPPKENPTESHSKVTESENTSFTGYDSDSKPSVSGLVSKGPAPSISGIAVSSKVNLLESKSKVTDIQAASTLASVGAPKPKPDVKESEKIQLKEAGKSDTSQEELKTASKSEVTKDGTNAKFDCKEATRDIPIKATSAVSTSKELTEKQNASKENTTPKNTEMGIDAKETSDKPVLTAAGPSTEVKTKAPKAASEAMSAVSDAEIDTRTSVVGSTGTEPKGDSDLAKYDYDSEFPVADSDNKPPKSDPKTTGSLISAAAATGSISKVRAKTAGIEVKNRLDTAKIDKPVSADTKITVSPPPRPLRAPPPPKDDFMSVEIFQTPGLKDVNENLSQDRMDSNRNPTSAVLVDADNKVEGVGSSKDKSETTKVDLAMNVNERDSSKPEKQQPSYQSQGWL